MLLAMRDNFGPGATNAAAIASAVSDVHDMPAPSSLPASRTSSIRPQRGGDADWRRRWHSRSPPVSDGRTMRRWTALTPRDSASRATSAALRALVAEIVSDER